MSETCDPPATATSSTSANVADSTMASAVALPDEELHNIASNGVKRRFSDSTEQEKEQDSKRQRISPGKNSPPASTERDTDATAQLPAKDSKQQEQEQPSDTREARRKSSVADEKQRSKRLFGALLGSLNQPKDRTTKRRQEIESRRKAELQRQDDEHVEDKQRRREKLTEQRKRVDNDVEKENMRIRHKNMLDAANFLQTTAEPKIYYKPWDLRGDEEDRIEDQIRDAQAQIDRELNDFDRQRRRESRSRNAPDSPDPPRPTKDRPAESADGEAKDESREPDTKMADAGDEAPDKSTNDTEKPVEESESLTTDVNTNRNLSSPAVEEKQSSESTADKVVETEDDGEHVDGDEDAVIY